MKQPIINELSAIAFGHWIDRLAAKRRRQLGIPAEDFWKDPLLAITIAVGNQELDLFYVKHKR